MVRSQGVNKVRVCVGIRVLHTKKLFKRCRADMTCKSCGEKCFSLGFLPYLKSPIILGYMVCPS